MIATYLNLPVNFTIPPTISPSCKSVDVKTGLTEKVQLNIWDTAGQEKYQSISRIFYRAADVAFICFAIDDSSTAEHVKNWADAVREESPKCKIILVATKCDLASDEERKTATKKAQQQMEEIPYDGVCETSAVNKIGLVEVFTKAAVLGQASKRSDNDSINIANVSKRSSCC